MPTRDQHLRKAQHNERFFTSFDINLTPYLDWVITGIFYAALHYIRALAAKYRFTNISSYGDMDRLFNRLSVFRNNATIYSDYRQLKDDSRVARYEMDQLSPSDVVELRDVEFDRIKSFVLSNL
jgi:hypothetical protein